MTTSSSEPTREKVAGVLKVKGRATISELVDALGITHISVRHHLNHLLKEGLIEARLERHGVGRPRLVYQLTAAALERNSGRYMKLTDLLLHQLKAQLPPEMVEQLFRDMAAHMAHELRAKLEGLPLDERIESLIELLSPEGFIARVEPAGPDQFRLIELACPYATISLQHPEVCLMDTDVLSQALDANVERRTCIQSGSDSCTFTIADRMEKSP
jgi:DeoR family suf operon transcriptional repressor